MTVNLMELNDNEQIKKIKELVNANRCVKEMSKAVDYYNHRHDIEDLRMFYINNEGMAVEEKARSNVKISHSFFSQIVDQKVQYLLSNGIDIVANDNPELQALIDEYNNEDFLLSIQEALEGASIKGKEYLYLMRDSDNKLTLKVADAMNVIEYSDNFGNTLNIIRYYDKEAVIEGEKVTVRKYELYDTEQVKYFTEVATKGTVTEKKVILDPDYSINPRTHIVLVPEDGKGEVLGKGFGRLPFVRLDNNKSKASDLKPIKDLIDDYDLMASSLSNNLIDFDQPIYAVTGFNGDNLDTLVNNLKTKKVVNTGPNGSIDVKTVDIPVGARKEKLQLDKEGIFSFGMAVDTTQVGDGNITNVVIKSRYTLLNLKCDKSEIRLKKTVKDILKFIVDDINERNNTKFDASELEISFDRKLPLNDKDAADEELTREQTKQVAIENILSVSARIGDDKALQMICELYELDFDEIKEELDSAEYQGIGELARTEEALRLAMNKDKDLATGGE